MSKKKVVVSLGHDALGYTTNQQRDAVQITARALACMSLGMVGYGIQNVLSRAFYAGQNGKLPLISGLFSIVVNLGLCLLLTDRFDVAGLSIATAVSSTVSALVLLIPTAKRYRNLWNRAFWTGLLKMALSAAGMGLLVWGSSHFLQSVLPDGLIARVILVTVPTILGVGSYFGLTLLLGLPELRVVKQFLKK